MGDQWRNDNMWYGTEGLDGLSELAASEMGQFADMGADAPAAGQAQWTPEHLQQIGQSVQGLSKQYAESLQTQALAKYGPLIQRQQALQQMQQQAGGGGGGDIGMPSPQPPWLKPALVVGGLALAGFAAWYFLKKRKTASNPGRDDGGWHTIGD